MVELGRHTATAMRRISILFPMQQLLNRGFHCLSSFFLFIFNSCILFSLNPISVFHARETVGKRDTWNVADCDAYWHLLRDRSRHPLPRRVCLFVYLSGIITRRWKRKGAKQNTRRWTSHFGRIGIFLTLYYTSSVNVNGNGWHRRDGGGPRSERARAAQLLLQHQLPKRTSPLMKRKGKPLVRSIAHCTLEGDE